MKMHLATGQKIWRWKWQSGTVGSVAASPFWFHPERCLFSVWGFARSPGFYMSFLLVLWFTPTSQKPWWWIVYNKLPLSMDVFCIVRNVSLCFWDNLSRGCYRLQNLLLSTFFTAFTEDLTSTKRF